MSVHNDIFLFLNFFFFLFFFFFFFLVFLMDYYDCRRRLCVEHQQNFLFFFKYFYSFLSFGTDEHRKLILFHIFFYFYFIVRLEIKSIDSQKLEPLDKRDKFTVSLNTKTKKLNEIQVTTMTLSIFRWVGFSSYFIGAFDKCTTSIYNFKICMQLCTFVRDRLFQTVKHRLVFFFLNKK